ncbi:MAG: restriction endonuclease subunit S [Polaribacter sp.]
MNFKNFIKKLGFLPKENTTKIFHKKYNGYPIEIDFEKNQFNFGSKIKFGYSERTTQSIVKLEDWVVLECVNRLLEKGYHPKDIILEKTYPSGHGHSGRLDILVKKGNSSFLMIECKTFGKKYKKELVNIYKKGGQLFTYFQNDTNVEFLMLYTSSLVEDKIVFKNEIIKIEDNYRTAGNVEDVFNRWNKVTNQNGIFEDWVEAYNFENKLLTKNELKPLNQKDSSFIFHEFLSILRKHSVSDKPNAFNKIFNLFLAKIYDEKKRPNDELDFQWREKKDTAVDFQIRLINLYKEGMYAFLEKEVAGINDDDFQFFPPEKIAAQKKKWLMFNNVFAIKEVIDNESFDDNQRVLKEVVELLHKYRIRYPRRQQHLSDFFERLLTTGLKQEVGQYFTPPPITKFIIKSLPVEQEIKKTLNNPIAELPAVIDYAVGSGHFITEMLEEYQTIIDSLKTKNFYPEVAKKVKTWVVDKYDWASKYVYGVDKDYRLVKVAKVGCYFYGDGLAQIIHGDGLDNFKESKSYRGLLKQKEDKSDNGKFSFVISNPPYSVSSFKVNLKNKNAAKDFELYKYLTDRSSEIECLFIERTKQLLKQDGIASLVLPSSILSNSGIYAKAREIILKDFDIIAITELGSATFMATGTNTVVLFLKRRKTSFAPNIEEKVNNAFTNTKDVTINGIENPISKYLTNTWENISFEDYKTLLKNEPNETIKNHAIYKEYQKKIKGKNTAEKSNKIIQLEKEKCFYFIMTYHQKIVLVKTGNKKEEKQFLGYEFSNRRGSEGIHPIQRGKSIDECTSLFANTDNPEKANYYIKKAFTENVFNLEIPENLQKNIFYQNLTDLLTFDRTVFDKGISLSVKKKVKIESKWEIIRLGDLKEVDFINGFAFKSQNLTSIKSSNTQFPVLKIGNIVIDRNIVDLDKCEYHELSNLSSKIVDNNDLAIALTGATVGKAGWVKEKNLLNQRVLALRGDKKILEYISNFIFGKYFYDYSQNIAHGNAQGNLSPNEVKDFKIPFPPIEIQEKIVARIQVLKQRENSIIEEIKKSRENLKFLISSIKFDKVKLENVAEIISGQSPKSINYNHINKGLPFYQGKLDFTNKYIKEPSVWTTQITKKSLKDDILMSVRAPVGDVNVNLIGNICIGRGLCAIRVKDNVLQNYLFNTLNIMKNEIESLSNKGSTFKAINRNQILSIYIPLPPIKEQQKIVSAIEKIEVTITTLEKEIAEIPKLKEAILKKYL